jgi:formamidopyrimidine-DNA glycosylase
MPELPEVETVRRGLARALVGARVRGTELHRGDLRWPIPRARVAALAGRRLLEVARRSKYLLLRFSGRDAPCVLVHLGMSGRLFVSRRSDDLALQPHEHWRLHFGPRVLRYVDPRRFGVLDVLHGEEAATHKLLAALGPEPLTKSFDGAYLHAATRGRRTAIKSFLMDSKNVVGVGNIYASEALFAAGVRPTRRAHTLRRNECAALAAAVRATLRAAVAAGGTTIRDYIGVDQDTGSFQRELKVYGRAGAPCRRCGAPITSIVQQGRSTYFCWRCQR